MKLLLRAIICFYFHFLDVKADDALCEWTREEQPIMLERLNQTLQVSNPHKLISNICGYGTSYKQSDILTSPNYPDNYDNNCDCYVYIHAPKRYEIDLTIDFFSMQYKWDYFYIAQSDFDSHDDSNFNTIATLNGQYKNDMNYTLKNNVRLYFYTNSLIRCLGVHLFWNAKPTFAISPPKNSTCPGPDILFLLDRSQVIIPDYYNNNITAFLTDVTASFGFTDDVTPQNPYHSRFGVIQFSDSYDLSVALDDYTRYNFLSQVQQNVNYANGGDSNIQSALSLAYQIFDSIANPNNSQSPAPKVIVLIVNDVSMFHYNDTLEAMNKLKTLGTLPLGIIVHGISGTPPGAQKRLGDLLGNQNNAFNSLNSAVSGIPSIIHQSTSSCDTQTICSDLIFIGEATSAIGWDGKLRFLKLAQQLAAATAQTSKQRYAIALFGVEIYNNIQMQSFNDFNKTITDLIVNVAANNMPNGGQTYLSPILNQLYDTLGSGLSPSNYAVLLMGETGAIRDPSTAFQAAQNIASRGADVYVLDQSNSGSSPSSLWNTLTSNKFGHIVNGTAITLIDDLFNTFQSTLLQDFSRMSC